MRLFDNTQDLSRAMAYTTSSGDKVYPIIVDIKRGIQGSEEISFVSSDIRTGVISVALMNNNTPYNVHEYTVLCTVLRPDASMFEVECECIQDNIIEIELGTLGTRLDGIYSFDIKIQVSETKTIGTPQMSYSVAQSLDMDEVILEDDRVPVLTTLITQTEEAVDTANQSLDRVISLESEMQGIIQEGRTTVDETTVALSNVSTALGEVDGAIVRLDNAISKGEQDIADAIASIPSKEELKGDKGETGAGLNVLGSLSSSEDLPEIGIAGDAYLINGDLYVWSEASQLWLNVGNIKGEKGDKGEQGIQGLKGDKGDKGDTGEKGEKGDAFTYEDFTPEQLVLLKGEQGEKGDKGDKGDEYDDTEIRGLISSLSKRIELLENQSPPIEVNDIKLLYNFNNLKRGYAEGTISLQTSGEANAGKYYIKWADENGELSEYEEITVFEMFGVNAIQTYNFIKLNLIPIEASRIVAIKDNVIKASFNIPSNKRITDSKKLSFGLISDMHVDGSGGSSSEANDDFVRALKYFDSKQVDMNILTGDAVNNGLLVDLEAFKSLKGSSTNVPLYVCRGNHDTYNDCNVDNFTSYIEENGLHFEKEIKGDKYLFIGLDAEDFTNPFRRDSMEWLKTKLEEYKNQRVFLMQHVFVGETGNIGGLYPHSDGFDMTEGTCSKEFVDLVSKYRNVIMFTGHSHLDFELQRLGENANVALRTKTLCHRVHTPSTSKPRKNDSNTADIPDNTYTYREGSQGYLVDVYDSYIVLHGIDFKKGLLLPYAQYILDTTPILIEGDNNTSYEHKLLSEITSFSLGSLSSSGADRESSSSYRTDFIELNERDNKTFILPRGLTYLRICIYDENKTFLKLNEENDNNETPSKTDEIRNLENVTGAKYIKLKCQGDIENIRFNGSI